MRAEDIRSFLDRDWQLVADAKAAFWAERKRAFGVVEALRVSDELRRQVIATRPDWPTADERAADLAAHLRLSRLLRDASAARGD